MFPSSKRIFLAYTLTIALLAGHAWRLHTGQLERSKRYENSLECHDFMLKQLWRDMESSWSQVAKFRDYMRDSLHDMRFEQANYTLSFCKEQLRENALLISHLYPNGYRTDEGNGWNNADDTRSEAMLQRMAIIGDSLQLFCADMPKTLEVVKQHFSETHLARIAEVLRHGTRAEKAVALSELRFGMLTASLRVMRILDEPIPPEKIAYMPVFNMQNKAVHVGDVLSGELLGVSYWPEGQNLHITVNGKPIPVENGIGKFSACFTKAGTQKLEVSILDTDLITGTKDYYNRFFTLEIRP
jgi:hypothetical protein